MRARGERVEGSGAPEREMAMWGVGDGLGWSGLESAIRISVRGSDWPALQGRGDACSGV